MLMVADLVPGATDGAISDIAAADFDGDGLDDLAVAWFASYSGVPQNNRRRLSIFVGGAGGPQLWQEFNLYIRDPVLETLNVFRNGTAAMTAGDFDGDGDQDIAVTAFFGDELWLIENLGNGNFRTHLKFPFSFNSPSNFLTPPEAAAADFDGDGRDELVYLADPIQHIQGRIVHFWKTTTTIAAMQRVNWEGDGNTVVTQWTRALAIADFTGDGRPDLCFSGTDSPPLETSPLLTFWHSLNPSLGSFEVHHERPTVLMADIVASPLPGACGPTLLLTDLSGAKIELWRPTLPCAAGSVDYDWAGSLLGYAGLSPNRGMAAALGDLNGDGRADLVTRQRIGAESNGNQIEITLGLTGVPEWLRIPAGTLNSSGFRNNPNSQVLRPRAIVVADVSGSRLPDVIAGFGLLPQTGAPPRSRLALGLWSSSCGGDVSNNGRTNGVDENLIVERLEQCKGQAGYVPALDLDRDGCITDEDLRRVQNDLGCASCGLLLGDVNCDGLVSAGDVNGFVQALTNLGAFGRAHPLGDPALADMNSDGILSVSDIELFVDAVIHGVSGATRS